MMIDDQTHGRLTPQKVRKLIRQYRRDAAKVGGRPPEKAVSSMEAVSGA
jgi:hypothetical protein